MRAGPVSAAALHVLSAAAEQHTSFPHAHSDEAEYAAFIDTLTICPAFRRQRRNHQSRFIKLGRICARGSLSLSSPVWLGTPGRPSRRCSIAPATTVGATSTILG